MAQDNEPWTNLSNHFWANWLSKNTKRTVFSMTRTTHLHSGTRYVKTKNIRTLKQNYHKHNGLEVVFNGKLKIYNRIHRHFQPTFNLLTLSSPIINSSGACIVRTTRTQFCCVFKWKQNRTNSGSSICCSELIAECHQLIAVSYGLLYNRFEYR